MSRRKESKYPYLEKSLNTKRRQDYIDNIYYVEGVESVDYKSDDLGIRKLNEEEKDWLNRFNKEYYGASFDKVDNNNLHKLTASEVEIKAQKDYISELKAEARELDRSNKDPDKLRDLYDLIEDEIDKLIIMYPRKSCTDANNERNRCLLNLGKLTNKVKLIPWGPFDQNTLSDDDLDIIYSLFDFDDHSID